MHKLFIKDGHDEVHTPGFIFEYFTTKSNSFCRQGSVLYKFARLVSGILTKCNTRFELKQVFCTSIWRACACQKAYQIQKVICVQFPSTFTSKALVTMMKFELFFNRQPACSACPCYRSRLFELSFWPVMFFLFICWVF